MEQKTPFKELTFSQKIQYIWDYYKIPIFLVIIGIIAVTTFIHGRLAQKNTVLSVLCVNAENSTTEDNGADIFNDFLTDNGYDLSKDEIALNKNICVDVDKSGLDYQNMAVLTAYFASNEYDICFMDDKTFDYYAKNVCFEDISKYLDKAALEKYKDRLANVTIDGKDILVVSGFQQMTMNLSKPPAYTLHVLSECAVTPPTMLWSKNYAATYYSSRISISSAFIL